MKKFVLFVGAVLFILAAVVIFRTARLGRAPADSVQATADFQVNSVEAAERFAGAIRFPTVSTPYLVFGGTDARHYSGHSPNVFRFLPISMGEGDLERFQGTNERVAVDNLALSIRYFYQLIRNSEAI